MEEVMIIPRDKAIRTLYDLVDKFIGEEKGSGDKWCDLMIESYNFDDPPSLEELFIAAGISPQEIHEFLMINPNCFPDKLCKEYGFISVKAKGHWAE